MKNQPFIGPLAGLMLGILFAEISPFTSLANGVLLLFAFLFFILLIYFRIKKWDFLWIFCAFTLGGWLYSTDFNTYKPIPESVLDQEVNLKLEIEEIYRPSAKFRKYKAKIIEIDSAFADNYVLLYWRKENTELFPQDEVEIKAKIIPTQKPLNPYQFDYAKWLKRQKIHYTVFSDTLYKKTKDGNSVASKTSSYKRNTHRKLMEKGYTKSSADLIGAMLLGDRTEMDPDTEENYRKTGVVHILSISGLHVMMVYSIFMLVLYPLIYLRNGRILRILLSLILIWSFVIFVGFQPPVLRSAVMISVYYVTVTFRRKPNIYHTLAVSAFVLLWINPNFLFDVGFQLSFSAVFFIVYLHPIYQRIFRPKKRLMRNSIAFIGTSISAQLGTMPFTVLYFNQTSGLFLAGNVVMVIASYFMMAGGMLALVLLEINFNPGGWVWLFNGIIEGCNSYIRWLSSFDSLVFENISFNPLESFLALLLIILVGIIWRKPNFKGALTILLVLISFQVQRIIHQNQLSKKKELIVFHQTRNSVIGVRNGRNLDVFAMDLSDSLNLTKYLIRPYVLNEGIRTYQLKSLEKKIDSPYFKSSNSLYFERNHLVWLAENWVDFSLDSDFLLVQNNIDFELEEINPETILILDGSNYPNHLIDLELPIWRTREKGAFIFPIKDSPEVELSAYSLKAASLDARRD